MPKDPLLAEAFFYLPSFVSDPELMQWETWDQLMRQKLYSHLSSEQTPTYYNGARNMRDLSRFAYKNQVDLAYTDQFKALQAELSYLINKIKLWSVTHNIEYTESLSSFLKKVEKPVDNALPFYSEGKKLLEKISILLDEQRITLEFRKATMSDLLDNNELEHCIAGCFSRVTSAALKLQENLNDDSQINYWLRSYAKTIAGYVAAKSPFSLSDSFQVLVCKSADSAVEQNTLHANHYLLMQAKKQGFPIQLENDSGAIELGNKLTQLSEVAITSVYAEELDRQITAKNLVYYLSEKFHENFSLVMSYNINYADKMTLITNKLNLLGTDTGFTLDELGLGILGSGQLKSVDSLKITVTERLIDRGLIRGYELKNYLLPDKSQLRYREFSPAIELTWFWLKGERKRFLQLLEEDSIANILPLVKDLIKNTHSLLLVMKILPKHHMKDFLSLISPREMSIFSTQHHSFQLFQELLMEIPDQKNRKIFLECCGRKFVHKMLIESINAIGISGLFHGLSISYSRENYNEAAKYEGLKFSKELINQLINADFKDFQAIIFQRIDHLNYLEGIDFSRLNLQNSKFFQPLHHCSFHEAQLQGAMFFSPLAEVSFAKADLREVTFQQLPAVAPSYAIDLEDAILSTESFKGLRVSYGVAAFRKANLKEVDFQELTISRSLERIDFSEANLELADLSFLSLQYIKFQGANLQQAKLQGSNLRGIFISMDTNLRSSELDLSDIIDFHSKGIKNYDACKIYIDIDFTEPNQLHASFYKTSFKDTLFIGKNLDVDFAECNLIASKFRHVPLSESTQPTMDLSINLFKSNLDFSEFSQVNFITTKFVESTLKELVFDEVKMSANSLFSFYKAGNRNFQKVKELKGSIPTRLLPFPVLDAELNKKTFIHLYRQGLRDFRGSNLNSFYLGEVLKEQAISEIELKLEGARYKQTPFACVLSPTRQKKAIRHSTALQSCAVHMLLQNEVTAPANRITPADIAALITVEDSTQLVLSEAFLGIKPIYTFSQTTEINFYLTYAPSDQNFIESFEFLSRSIAISERAQTKIRFYFYKQLEDSPPILSVFAQQSQQAGFSDMRLYYYNTDKKWVATQLKNDHIATIGAKQPTVFDSDLSLLLKIKLQTSKFRNNPKYYAQLRRITSKIKINLATNTQAGIQRGAHYEIGAAILYLVGEAINKPSTPEIRTLSSEEQTLLKELAEEVAQNIGHERGASATQIESALNLAARCIDRGECATEEEVIKDVLDSMYRMRTDLMIGNEHAWNKTKDFFKNLGDYLVEQWEKLGDFSQEAATHSLSNTGSMNDSFVPFFPPPTRKRIEKRIISNWYEKPLLMRLIKEVEVSFDNLECEIDLHPQFSEARLAGILCDILKSFTEYKKNSTAAKAEAILDFLMDKVADTDKYLALNKTSLSNVTAPVRRDRRSVRLMAITQQQDDRIQDIAESYLVRHEHPKNRRPTLTAKARLSADTSIKSIIAQEVNLRNVTASKQRSLGVSKKNFTLLLHKSSRNKPEITQKRDERRYEKQVVPYFFTNTKKEFSLNKSREHQSVHVPLPPLLAKESKLNIPYAHPRQLGFVRNQKQQAFSSLSQVNAAVDVPNTLFALNVWIRGITKEKYHLFSAKKSYLQQRADKVTSKSKSNIISLKG